MKKSKLVLAVLLAALAASCSESYGPVTVPFSGRGVADIAAYRNVYFIDFVSDVPDAGIAAEAEIRRAFTEEIPFAIDRKVTLLEPDHWADIRGVLQKYRLNIDVDYGNSVFFQNVFKSNPHSLFFAGKLKLEIKKVGVIKEIRDETGNRRNAYETTQLWEMEARFFLIDGDASRILLQESYKEKLEAGPETAPQFNFSSMFARLSAKLIAALQPRKTLQERFIIK
jgi:hypothetical protein